MPLRHFTGLCVILWELGCWSIDSDEITQNACLHNLHTCTLPDCYPAKLASCLLSAWFSCSIDRRTMAMLHQAWQLGLPSLHGIDLSPLAGHCETFLGSQVKCSFPAPREHHVSEGLPVGLPPKQAKRASSHGNACNVLHAHPAGGLRRDLWAQCPHELRVFRQHLQPLSVWCRRQGSNPRPSAYKATALPSELHRQIWRAAQESNPHETD